MNEAKETRRIFDVLDKGSASEWMYMKDIRDAADRYALDADLDTVAMYWERGLPLTPRLQKLARAYGHTDWSKRAAELRKRSEPKQGNSIAALKRTLSTGNYKPTYSARYEDHMRSNKAGESNTSTNNACAVEDPRDREYVYSWDRQVYKEWFTKSTPEDREDVAKAVRDTDSRRGFTPTGYWTP